MVEMKIPKHARSQHKQKKIKGNLVRLGTHDVTKNIYAVIVSKTCIQIQANVSSQSTQIAPDQRCNGCGQAKRLHAGRRTRRIIRGSDGSHARERAACAHALMR